MIGKTILNWKTIEKLGAGGMCEVYKAENQDMKGSYAAIKCLKEEHLKNSDVRNRFRKEATKMLNFQERAGSTHQNIIEFKNFKKQEDNDFLITEFVEGVTLKKYIEEDQGPIPPEKAILIFRQILDACSHMHKYNLFHRDLKPENIMLKPSGRIKILDFGIAKNFADEDETIEKTQAGLLVGTPKYMSPDQIQGKQINHLTDIYSLGVIYYEMLTGEYCYPSSKTLTQLTYKITNENLPSVKKTLEYLPSYYDKIISKATQKDPSKRAQSCDELIKMLEKVKDNYPISITVKLSDLIMAEFSINGKKEMANKITIEGVIGDSFPLTISKKRYKKVETNLNVNSFHQTKNLVEINLKKKFLGIF